LTQHHTPLPAESWHPSALRPYATSMWALVMLGIWVCALVLYIRTGAPSLLSGDQAEHQFTAYVVGVPHATGYPLFTMLNALAVRLVPFGDAARRVTLATAFYSAVAVALGFLASRRLTGSTLGGVLAAVTLALMPEFWSLATIAEVYTLQAVFILGTFLLLMRWWRLADHSDDLGLSRRGLRHPLAAAAFVAGLGVTHHGTFTPIVAPAVFVTVILPLLARLRVREQRPNVGRLVVRCVGWMLLGCTPWLYLAAQFLLYRPFDYYRGEGLPYHPYWGNPASWGDVANLALGAGFRLKIFTHGWDRLLGLLPGVLESFRHQFWWTGLALGAVGAVALFRRDRRAGWLMFIVWLDATLFGLNVAADVPKAHVYFLPAYVMGSLWIGVGGHTAARWLLGRVGHYDQREPPLVAGVLVVLTLVPVVIGGCRLGRMDRSADWINRQSAERVLDAVAPNAAILCRWEVCMSLRYLQLVEGRKLGVQLDQTEPEAGTNWAERVPLYAPAHPVYAVAPSPELRAAYVLEPLADGTDLWRVLEPTTSTASN
jgi:hypothetical protein